METTEEYQLINDKFPRIAKDIKILWGTELFIEYANKLVLDTRDGKRNGFPSEVLNAIMKLIKMHDDIFPRKPEKHFNDKFYRW